MGDTSIPSSIFKNLFAIAKASNLRAMASNLNKDNAKECRRPFAPSPDLALHARLRAQQRASNRSPALPGAQETETCEPPGQLANDVSTSDDLQPKSVDWRTTDKLTFHPHMSSDKPCRQPRLFFFAHSAAQVDHKKRVQAGCSYKLRLPVLNGC